jgi:serine/threonine protein kinase
MKKTFKIVVGGKSITLTEQNYKASGGEGTVFVLNDLAYKIYHDPKKMIPIAKIQELGTIQLEEVLAPIDVIYDISKDPIGFSMQYIDNVEFLCKIFTKTFRKDKGLSPNDIIEFVVQMQKTLEKVHKKGFVVADYNEMNFLLSLINKRIVYSIDVDSWQTKNFHATAIMESVRDRKTPKGKFNELSDWFSFAVVTFQMYTGIHPYKGFHPDFKPADFSKRMDLGVSVFDKKIKLPDACQDFSVIPQKHLEWYKSIFIKNDRSIPPYPDQIAVSGVVIRTITSKGDFIVQLIHEFVEPIKNVYFLNNELYIVTYTGIYLNNTKINEFKTIKHVNFELCNVFGEKPIIAYLSKDNVHFVDFDKKEISQIQAQDMMFSNGMIYTINNCQIVQNSFERLGKIIHSADVVCNISSSYKVFSGVIVQDDFTKCRLAIPFDNKKSVNIHIPELDQRRVIEAKYKDGICVLITEKKGDYFRTIICFDKEHSKYDLKEEDISTPHIINFIVLPNKLCIMVDDEKTVLFTDNKKRKEMTNAPFDVDMKLSNENMKVLFIDDNKLYSITMK